MPTSNEFLLKISLAKSNYNKKIDKIKSALLSKYLLYTITIALLSLSNVKLKYTTYA
jgi:hypothetical protein